MASTLDRLGPGDLAQMVDFRWRVASGGQEHPFDTEAIEALYDYSGGTPREAAILADASLLLAFLEKEKRITAATVKRAAHEREVNLKGQKEAA